MLAKAEFINKTKTDAIRKAKYEVSPVKLHRNFDDSENDRQIIYKTIYNFYEKFMSKLGIDIDDIGDIYLDALNEIRSFYAIDANRA